jgi:tetratricopeptide (TPR) repeat protein
MGEITEIKERKRRIERTLTSDNDEQSKILMAHTRDETLGLSEWNRLGRLTIRMKEWDKAEEVHRILLNMISKSDKLQRAYHYHQLELIKINKNDPKEAIQFYQNALDIQLRSLSRRHPYLVITYNQIAEMHLSMGNFSNSLKFYERVLLIQQKSGCTNNFDLANTYDNIVEVTQKMENYSTVLYFHQKALDIQLKFLPDDHLDSIPLTRIRAVYIPT